MGFLPLKSGFIILEYQIQYSAKGSNMSYSKSEEATVDLSFKKWIV